MPPCTGRISSMHCLQACEFLLLLIWTLLFCPGFCCCFLAFDLCTGGLRMNFTHKLPTKATSFLAQHLHSLVQTLEILLYTLKGERGRIQLTLKTVAAFLTYDIRSTCGSAGVCGCLRSASRVLSGPDAPFEQFGEGDGLGANKKRRTQQSLGIG